MPSAKPKKDAKSSKKKISKTECSTTTVKTRRNLEDFYTALYGDRWPSLKEALMADTRKVAVYNRYCTSPKQDVLEGLVRFEPLPPKTTSPTGDPSRQGLSHPLLSPGLELYVPAKGTVIERPPLDSFQIKGYYLLDFASTLVVEQLLLKPEDSVLDLCAAPGGKTVAIAQYLQNYNNLNLLTANEVSRDRFQRLKRTLAEYIPSRNNYNNPYYLNTIHYEVIMRDGQTFFAPEKYNKILVDAPCSSERHLLLQHYRDGNSTEYKKFNEHTSMEIAKTQKSLLLRALESVKVEGIVVYSTCSLSSYENDELVREVLRVTRVEVSVVTQSHIDHLYTGYTEAERAPTVGEATPMGGRLVLPDRCGGWGPMYYCTFKKLGEKRSFGQSVEEDDLFKQWEEEEEEEEEENA